VSLAIIFFANTFAKFAVALRPTQHAGIAHFNTIRVSHEPFEQGEDS
jgi:hypothetical protein